MTGPYQTLSPEQKAKLITYLIEGFDPKDLAEMFLETQSSEGLAEMLADADED
jgi:hypothetical protein